MLKNALVPYNNKAVLVNIAEEPEFKQLLSRQIQSNPGNIVMLLEPYHLRETIKKLQIRKESIQQQLEKLALEKDLYIAIQTHVGQLADFLVDATSKNLPFKQFITGWKLRLDQDYLHREGFTEFFGKYAGHRLINDFMRKISLLDIFSEQQEGISYTAMQLSFYDAVQAKINLDHEVARRLTEHEKLKEEICEINYKLEHLPKELEHAEANIKQAFVLDGSFKLTLKKVQSNF